ncbi:MAG: VWA domain-containing protein [Acidimicrobiia bacterium]
MTFASPKLLVLLVAVPFVIAAYVASVRKRSRRADELAAQSLVLTAGSRKLRKRRHLPFALFVTAVALMIVGFARPQTTISLPNREGTVILAFDVSNSMAAEDMAPTRIEAAKAAAHEFVKKQPTSIKIGIVAFGDSAVITQTPTSESTQVDEAIDRLAVGGGTSLGQGLFVSLSAIAGKPIQIDENALNSDTGGIDIGYFGNAAIVMLSDGENTGRPEPDIVAKAASVAGVRVYTIGLGTEAGTTVNVNGFNVATALDSTVLQQIADATEGRYFQATDADSLSKVYGSIDLKFKTVKKHTEVTSLFAGAGALLLVFGAVISVLWFGRVL